MIRTEARSSSALMPGDHDVPTSFITEAGNAALYFDSYSSHGLLRPSVRYLRDLATVAGDLADRLEKLGEGGAA